MPNFQKLQTEKQDVKKEYIFFLKTISLLAFPICCLFLLVPHELCTLLWGKSWKQVGDYLPFIGILLLMQSMTSTTGSMFVIYHKEKALFVMGTINALIMIAAIIMGAQFSALSILTYYSFAFIFLCIPITLIWGYRKSYSFSWVEICDVWSFDLIYCMIIFLSLIFNQPYVIYFLTAILIFLKSIRGYKLFKNNYQAK